MINNYFTIRAVVTEIHHAALHATVGEPFTQKKNEIVLPLRSDDLNDSPAMIISCDPARNFLSFKEHFSRARRNSASVFAQVDGRKIADIRVHPSDRIFAVEFEDRTSIVGQLFGPRANVFLLDANGVTMASFLRPGESADGAYPFPGATDPVDPIDRIRTSLNGSSGTGVAKTIRSALPMLGPVLVREILFRTGIDGETLTAALTPADLRSIETVTDAVLTELTGRTSPRIYYREDGSSLLSIIELRQFADDRVESQTSVSAAIFRLIASQRRETTFRSVHEDIIKRINSLLEKTHRSLSAIERDRSGDEDPEVLERYGKLLQSSMHELRQGMRTVVVEDFLSDGSPLVEIPIDPVIPPAKNVQRLFDRARKLRTRRQEHTEREHALRIDERMYEEMLRAVSELTTEDDTRAFLREYGDRIGLEAGGSSTSVREKTRPPFRVFTVHGGFQVWVGKSSDNNDLLSTRFTAKNDLWFHARSVGGSHVVLKRGSASGDISKRAILEAAGIAAHYSKMKNGLHVAVSMCEGKYVHKPKGAPSGTVRIEREEVVFADPAIPDQPDNTE